METKRKELYDAPAITVLHIRTRGILCQSDPLVPEPDAFTIPDYGPVTEI